MALRLIRRDVLVGAATSFAAFAFSVRSGYTATPKTHEIAIKSFKFEPEYIAVKLGDTIRWTNEDIAPHTATAKENGWDTGEIKQGESRSVKVTKDIGSDYFCAFHPHMKGKLKISET